MPENLECLRVLAEFAGKERDKQRQAEAKRLREEVEQKQRKAVIL